MEIRTTIIQDSIKIQCLLKQLGYELNLDQVQHKIMTYTNKDSHFTYVAEEDGEIIGFIAFILYECFVVVGGCMHIETVVVDETHRNKGVGQKLIAIAEACAVQHDCHISELITYNYRREKGTHAFYQKLGYEDNIKADISYFSKEI